MSWNTVGLYIKNMKITDRSCFQFQILTCVLRRAFEHAAVSESTWLNVRLHLKMLLWREFTGNVTQSVIKQTGQTTSYNFKRDEHVQTAYS